MTGGITKGDGSVADAATRGANRTALFHGVEGRANAGILANGRASPPA
ncbi:hypothetical protein [Actinoallomurus sp. NPDC052274]